MHPQRTPHGIEWGPAELDCGFSDDKKGWIVFILKTAKHPRGIQVYVTKTGKVRVLSSGADWTPPAQPADSNSPEFEGISATPTTQQE